MKRCSRCHVDKSEDQFGRHARQPDGLRRWCKACEGEYGKQHYERNAEVIRAKARVRTAEWRAKPGNAERNRDAAQHWAAENAEVARQRARQWREQHAERKRAADKAWRGANRARCNHITRKYKTMKCKAMPSWANEFFISEAYHLAKLRTEMTGYDWHVDHSVPLQHPLVCGLHVEHNLRVIPKRVNLEKGNRYWPDMP